MKLFRNLLSVALAAILLLSALFCSFPAAAEQNSVSLPAVAPDGHSYAPGETVDVIVKLDGAPAAEYGDYASDGAARRRDALKEQRAKIYSQLNGAGISFTLLAEYQSLYNGFSASVRYEDIGKIRKLRGVDSVILSKTFDLRDTDEIDSSAWTDPVSPLCELHEGDYTGKGTVIAVVDCGLRVTHEAFADYGRTDGWTEEQVKEKIAQFGVAPGKYISPKLPFVYDYANGDTDVMAYYGGEHGTHVAAIAAGYAEDAEGKVLFCGAAPDAQIVFMNVGREFTGSILSYMECFEDAYALGVDVITMSIGADCGFSEGDPEDAPMVEMADRLEAAGIPVHIAAANSANQARKTQNVTAQQLGAQTGLTDQILPTYYQDAGTVAFPSTVHSVISVAAAHGTKLHAKDFVCFGDSLFPLSTLSPDLFVSGFAGKDIPFVLVPGAGEISDYANLAVRGKIAVVKRGTISFALKTLYAQEMGAIGVLCVNNTKEKVNPTLGEEAPNIHIGFAMTDMEAMAAAVAVSSGGYGTLSVISGEYKGYPDPTTYAENVRELASFSSWGPDPDLTFGPDIAGLGYDVYAAAAGDDHGYILMSGTSMATPHVAGQVACMIQAFRETHPELSRKECADRIKKQLYSTASVLLTPDGVPYSPRLQGAGLIHITAAGKTDCYLENALIPLFDNAEGVFDFSVTVTNTSSEEKIFRLTPSVTTDTPVYSGEEGNYYATVPSPLTNGGQYRFFCSVPEGLVTVPAGSSATVNCRVALEDAFRTSFARFFTDGFFVDCYLKLKDLSETAPVDLHASLFGFVGDWAALPMFDKNDMLDYYDAWAWLQQTVDPATGLSYEQLGLTPEDILSDVNVGVSQVFAARLTSSDMPNLLYYSNCVDGKVLLTDRFHLAADQDPDSAAFNALVLKPALLRNARALYLVVRDENTGKIYDLTVDSFIPKSHLDNTGTAWKHFSAFAVQAYDYSGGEGNEAALPDGTALSVELYAVPEYAQLAQTVGEPSSAEEWDAFYRKVKEICGEPGWTVPVLVDAEAPAVSECRYDGDRMILTVRDSGILLESSLYFVGDADILAERKFYEETACGASHTFVYTAADLAPGLYRLCLTDFGTNGAEYYFSLDTDGHFHFFDPNAGFATDASPLYCFDGLTGELAAAADEDHVYYTLYLHTYPLIDRKRSPDTDSFAYRARIPLAGLGDRLLPSAAAGVTLSFDDTVRLEMTGDAYRALLSGGADFLSVERKEAEGAYSFRIVPTDAAGNLLPGEALSSAMLILNNLYDGEGILPASGRIFGLSGGVPKEICDAFDEERGAFAVPYSAEGYLITLPDLNGTLAELFGKEAEKKLTEAERLLAKAEAAQKTAEELASSAIAAERRAIEAETRAEEARRAAQEALAKAEEAKADATRSKEEAALLEASAALKQKLAEEARKEAEAAKKAAEQAKFDAETAKLDALANKLAVSHDKEQVQSILEEDRTIADSIKQYLMDVEKAYKEAEKDRLDTETVAASAKQYLEDAYRQKEEAEAARKAAEQAELNAENDRKAAKEALSDAEKLEHSTKTMTVITGCCGAVALAGLVGCAVLTVKKKKS